MTVIGSNGTGVTLSPSSPTVTITGAITGTLPVPGIYTYSPTTGLPVREDFYAAVQGGTAASFNILNLGTINSPGAETLDTGLFLANPGILINRGSIFGNNGVEILGSTTGAYVKNTGLIDGRSYTGLYLSDAGGINNTGTILGGYRAIYLSYGGAVNNSGLVSGKTGIFNLFGAGQVFNSGVIQGTVDDGAIINGPLINTGTITGHVVGVQIYSGASSTNAGTIVGQTGIILGGDLTNTGLVSGANTGTGIAANSGSAIYNYGTITAGTGIGSDFGGSATYIYNAGTIAGRQAGVVMGGSAALYNYGVISGGLIGTATGAGIYNYTGGRITASGIAISLAAAGYIYNAGIITGGATAIAVTGGIIADYGTISGTSAAIEATPDSDVNLFLSPTAVTHGTVNLGFGTIDLLAGPVTGKLSSRQFTGFTDMDINHGAVWNLSGTFGGAVVVNDGVIKETKSETLSLFVLDGPGTIDMPKFLNIAVDDNVTKFTGAAETLQLDSPTVITADIRNFAMGDTIILSGVAMADITGKTFSNNILTLKENIGSLAITFTSDKALTEDVFALSSSGTDAVAITLSKPPMSFLAPVAASSADVQFSTSYAPAIPLQTQSPSHTMSPTTSGFLQDLLTAAPSIAPFLTLRS